MSIVINSLRMRPTVSVFDTAAGPYLLQADVLDLNWLDIIRQHDMPEIRRVSRNKLKVSGTITGHLRTSEPRTRVTFGVASELVVPILLRTTVSFRFIKSIDPAERKMVLHHYPRVLSDIH